jgi:glycosyltransferase involved in cell wall biosynthesis
MRKVSSKEQEPGMPISYQDVIQQADLIMRTGIVPTASSTQTTMQSKNSGHIATMEMAVVIPTLNEGDNIVPLLEGIFAADERLHAIVVDDGSRDGTAEKAREFGRKFAESNGSVERVHVIDRGRKLGYASAIQDGMRYALRRGAKLILQMDADFSHDPKYLPGHSARKPRLRPRYRLTLYSWWRNGKLGYGSQNSVRRRECSRALSVEAPDARLHRRLSLLETRTHRNKRASRLERARLRVSVHDSGFTEEAARRYLRSADHFC